LANHKPIGHGAFKAHAVGQRWVVNFGVTQQPHVYEFRLVHTHKYTTFPARVKPYGYFFLKADKTNIALLVLLWT
jgi:hypothetical protein